VRSRFGSQLPFSVIGIDDATSSYKVARKDKQRGKANYTAEIYQGSTNWQERAGRFEALFGCAEERVSEERSGGDLNASLWSVAGTMGLASFPDVADALIIVDATTRQILVRRLSTLQLEIT
jgi:hypothetical protein